jgi:hypothetical protein
MKRKRREKEKHYLENHLPLPHLAAKNYIGDDLHPSIKIIERERKMFFFFVGNFSTEIFISFLVTQIPRKCM